MSFLLPVDHDYSRSHLLAAVTLAKVGFGSALTQQNRLSRIGGRPLGCRVAMQTVQQLYIKSIDVAQVCLMAAAIDNDSLAEVANYRAAAQYAGRTAVLYSPSDMVLRAAYPAGNLLSAFLHWSATTDTALRFTGPRACSDGSIADRVRATGIPAPNKVNHGDYLPNYDGTANCMQLLAARYANAVLAGLEPLVHG